MFERAEYERRLALLRDAMAEAGADVMIVDESELLCWLTGYMASETMYRAAVVPGDGTPWFVLRALDVEVCRQASWFEDIVGHLDAEDPVAFIAATLADRGHAAASIGADTHSYCLSADLYGRFRALLPEADWVAMPNISGRLRAIKSEAEIDMIARAATVADDTMEVLRTWRSLASRRARPMRWRLANSSAEAATMAASASWSREKATASSFMRACPTSDCRRATFCMSN